VTGALAFLALVLLVAGASAWAGRLPRRLAWLPVGGLALLAGALGFETARYDLGEPEAFRGVAWIGAPVVAIFGGALWGSRRFYGWPDLGPLPGHLALVTGGVLLGVILGTSQAGRDLEVSQGRAEALRTTLVAWRDAHGGAWPPRIEEAGASPTRSSMGLLAPPPIEYGERGGRRVLWFKVSGDRVRVLDLAQARWSTEEA
jgi:hypothetical protein